MKTIRTSASLLAILALAFLDVAWAQGHPQTADPAAEHAIHVPAEIEWASGPPSLPVAWAKGETVVQLHGMGPWSIQYLDPADDPRNAKK